MEKLDIAKIENRLKPFLKNHKTYKGFANSNDSYKYAEVINEYAHYCLYCNMESIVVHRKEDKQKGDRGCFDHFVSQKKSKKMALDIHNLIPCCHKCNSSYKGSLDLASEILNPFKESFNSLAEFYMEVEPEQIGKFNNFNFCIEITTKDIELLNKTKATIKTFNLINRYNGKDVKGELKDFIKILFNTTGFKFKDYLNISGLLNKEQVFDFISFPFENINKVKYGKLKNDFIKKYLNI